MNELVRLLPSLAAGLMLGAFFFGGLWWTVLKGVSSPRPALWFIGSMLLRTGIALAVLYGVGREDWRRWLACLLGFVLVRIVTRRLIRLPIDQHRAGASETSYAP